MKTLNAIKEEVAKEEGHESWYDLKESWMTQKDILEGYMEDVAKRYAEQALDEAADKAEIDLDYQYDYDAACEFPTYSVDRESILSIKEQLK